MCVKNAASYTNIYTMPQRYTIIYFLHSPYHGKCGILYLPNNNCMMPQKCGILPPSNLHDAEKMWHPTHIQCQFYICMMPKKCGILPPSNLHNATKMRHPTPSNIKFICVRRRKNAASYSIQCQFYICMMTKKCGILPHQISILYWHDAAKMRHPTPIQCQFYICMTPQKCGILHPISVHDAAFLRHSMLTIHYIYIGCRKIGILFQSYIIYYTNNAEKNSVSPEQCIYLKCHIYDAAFPTG
jgi:hypothetical protein